MRGRTNVAGLLLVVGLAGCGAGGERAAPAPAAPSGTVDYPSVEERFTPDIPAELRVREPQDARGIAVCDLLTGAQLHELGLDQATTRMEQQQRSTGCSWRHVDGSTRAGINVSTDPIAQKLPDLYRLRNTFARFEITEVDGHPTIRGDDTDRPGCTLYVGIADEQMMSVDAYLDGRELPDPCAPARRMAEMVLANVPPLR